MAGPYGLTVSQIFRSTQRQFGDEGGVQIVEEDIIRWINDAQREAVMQTEGLMEVVGYLDSIAGETHYDLPENCWQLKSVYAQDYAGGPYYVLKFLGTAEFNQRLDGWDGSTAQGAARVYGREGTKLLIFQPLDVSTINGLKLVYSRFAEPVIDQTSEIDLPPEYHSYVKNFCLMQAFEMDEDWQANNIKAQQVQGDLNWNSNSKQWMNKETYPTITDNFGDM